MDRQRAEYYLRTEVEAELRRPEQDPRRVTRIADVLTVIGALDETVADQIVDEFQLTLILRQGDERDLKRFRPRSTRRVHAIHPPAPVTLTVVPVGQVVEIGELGAEMIVLSYAETASGALIVTCGRADSRSGHAALPFSAQPKILRYAATDDRGSSYRVGYFCSGNPAGEWMLQLHPLPQPRPRWLDLSAAEGEPPVRLDLSRPSDKADVTIGPATLSPGELLLARLAADVLTWRPADRPSRDAEPKGLDDIIATLRSCDALPPASPVPGQLVSLTAAFRGEPPVLPEPWADVLAHRAVPPPDPSFAVVSAVLPEIDGVTVAILGLHTYPSGTILHTYFSGLTARFGPQQRDVTPLVWILDSDGHWHVTVDIAGTTVTDGQSLARLRVVPPLGPGIDWIEVHAVGQTTDVRARLPLRWL
jgi:hypothetical protein